MLVSPDDHTAEAALYRRQLVLAAVVAGVVALCVAGVLWAMAGGIEPARAVVRPVYYAGSDPLFNAHVPQSRSSIWLARAALAGAAVTIVVLAVAVTHVVRVATFTFRRGGD